ncbi:MAG: polysaccharide deacetylase family protein [Gammaproteobacteria bacterium]|nr:polysaccharide deacetylase family protein [Gammaproteobacteria bacterium]
MAARKKKVAKKKAKKKVAKKRAAPKKTARKKSKKKSARKKKKAAAKKKSPRVELTQSEHYDYVPIIDRAPFKLPNGARVAVMPYINIEHFPAAIPGTPLVPGTAGFSPDPLNYGWRDYGNRVGLWRMMDLMDDCGMRGTVCLNGEIIREYPRIIEEGEKRNWAWIGHGVNNAPANFIGNVRQPDGSLQELSEKKERSILEATLKGMEKALGRKTKGWLSPFLTHTNNTPRLLEEYGVEYLCDYTADDHPFRFNTPKNDLISVPYTVELNDIPAFLNLGVSSEAFGDMIIDQFDVLYDEGETNARCMPICLHTFHVGQPNKFKHLARAFEYIASHKDVWLTTGDEVNDWYRKKYM